MNLLRVNEYIHYQIKLQEGSPPSEILNQFVYLESIADENLLYEYLVQTEDVYIWDGGVYRNRDRHIYTMSDIEHIHHDLCHRVLLHYAVQARSYEHGILEIRRSHQVFEKLVQETWQYLFIADEKNAQIFLEVYYVLMNAGNATLADTWLKNGHLGVQWPQKVVLVGSSEHVHIMEYLSKLYQQYGSYQKVLSHLKMHS